VTLKIIRVLLENLIDYAGLFPPAALTLEQAVRNYAGYRTGDYCWALGRFVVPVRLLKDLENVSALLGDGDESPWLLTALVGADAARDLSRVLEFNARHSRGPGRPHMRIDTVEIKSPGSEELHRIAESLPVGLQAYFEIPLAADPLPHLQELGRLGARAKIRTGGLTPESVPSTAEVQRFLHACRSSRLAFKATAGLHHALRSVYPLTYEADSLRSTMHGFLNLILAAAFVGSGLDAEQTGALLEESSGAAFRFDDDRITWRSRRLSLEAIAGTRRDFAVAFGSCSFTEPIEDLKRLNFLP
jgi:hypothetical protein